jgi:6-phosphofructokinase
MLESFNSVCHFFGYQGRCAIPSGLDRNLAYTYGKIAQKLIQNNLTGFCPSVRGLIKNPP